MRLIRSRELEAKIGLVERVVREMEAAGHFPKRVTINPNGGRAVGWFEHEVDEWLAARLAAREEAA